MKIVNDEQGFASAVGICWLAVLMFLGGTVYWISERETLTVNRFLMGRKLQLAAEDGVLIGSRKLLDSPELQTEILNSAAAKKVLTTTDEDVSCDVFFSHKGDQLEVLARSTNSLAEVRCIGILKKKGEKYYFDHRER